MRKSRFTEEQMVREQPVERLHVNAVDLGQRRP
jgi:hypothetical protein